VIHAESSLDAERHMVDRISEYRDFVLTALEASIYVRPMEYGLWERDLVAVAKAAGRGAGAIRDAVADLLKQGTIAPTTHGKLVFVPKAGEHRFANFALGMYRPKDPRNLSAFDFVMWFLEKKWEEHGSGNDGASFDELLREAPGFAQDIQRRDLEIAVTVCLLDERLHLDKGLYWRTERGITLGRPASERNQGGPRVFEYPQLTNVYKHVEIAVEGGLVRGSPIPLTAATNMPLTTPMEPTPPVPTEPEAPVTLFREAKALLAEVKSKDEGVVDQHRSRLDALRLLASGAELSPDAEGKLREYVRQAAAKGQAALAHVVRATSAAKPATEGDAEVHALIAGAATRELKGAERALEKGRDELTELLAEGKAAAAESDPVRVAKIEAGVEKLRIASE
jgi:hypothetical protein